MRVIRRRRTNLRIDREAPVDPEIVAELCLAATWAPNHKLSEPWRFAVLTGAARKRLGEIAAGGLLRAGVTDETRLQQTAVKYLRAPVVVAVGCAPHPDPIRHAEDRDAVAAGVQNFLLAATAAGLASYWATGPAARLPETVELCEFEPGTEIVALVYLGRPSGEAPDTNRQPPRITWLGRGSDEAKSSQ